MKARKDKDKKAKQKAEAETAAAAKAPAGAEAKGLLVTSTGALETRELHRITGGLR